MKLVLWLAVKKGWKLVSYDAKGFFLNNKFEKGEKYYVEQPPGYEQKDRESWFGGSTEPCTACRVLPISLVRF